MVTYLAYRCRRKVYGCVSLFFFCDSLGFFLPGCVSRTHFTPPSVVTTSRCGNNVEEIHNQIGHWHYAVSGLQILGLDKDLIYHSRIHPYISFGLLFYIFFFWGFGVLGNSKQVLKAKQKPFAWRGNSIHTYI